MLSGCGDGLLDCASSGVAFLHKDNSKYDHGLAKKELKKIEADKKSFIYMLNKQRFCINEIIYDCHFLRSLIKIIQHKKIL